MDRVSPVYGLLTLAYMAGLFYLSSLPESSTGPNTPGWRLLSNGAHVPLFAGLALCLALTFRRWPLGGRSLAVLVIGAAYAVLDEWHQSLIPDRSASLTDVGLDLIGLLIVVSACHLMGRQA
jgi:VanZ family protein